MGISGIYIASIKGLSWVSVLLPFYDAMSLTDISTPLTLLWLPDSTLVQMSFSSHTLFTAIIWKSGPVIGTLPQLALKVHIAQDGLHIAQDGLHIAQDGLHIAQDGLHIAQDVLHITQDGLHIAQDALP